MRKQATGVKAITSLVATLNIADAKTPKNTQVIPIRTDEITVLRKLKFNCNAVSPQKFLINIKLKLIKNTINYPAFY